MSAGQGTSGGSGFAALVATVGLLIAFSIFFNLFLIVPFFIFIGGIIAMVISDHRRDEPEQTTSPEEGS